VPIVSWSQHAEWWRFEVEGDAAYESVVTPLLLEVLEPEPGCIYLDIGCGEGRVMRTVTGLGSPVHGVDLSPGLVEGVDGAVVGDALALPFDAGTYDGVYCVLTLEHIEDHVGLFAEAARVTKPGGVLGLVINHPVWTAPDSTPITDDDGETLWRPGEYFSNGTTEIPAGENTVTFYHRSMADIMNAASAAGWGLEHMVEQPHHEFEDQSGIPRLLACRWRLG